MPLSGVFDKNNYFYEKNIEVEIENYRTAFLNYLEENLKSKEPENLYGPISYIMALGGKRMRPILVLMACDLFGGKYKEAMEAALSVEMFHNFTLIHDDIMDSADLRRGHETVHKKWDLNTGILSGDALMIQSNQRLEHYDGEIFKRLVSIYNKTALEVCEGQQYDVDFETQALVPLSDYIKMISYKTAVLVGASLQMGAIIAGASEEDQQSIYDFGLNLGIAFQLQDDYLDTYGSRDFGKRIGGDIVESKKTFLYIKALELAGEPDEKRLMELYKIDIEDEKKIQNVKSIFSAYKVNELLKNEIENYTQKALEDIAALTIDESRKAVLQEFAVQLMTRKT